MFRREFAKSLLSLPFFSFLGITPPKKKEEDEIIVVDHRKDAYCIIDADGSQQFYKNGQFHRDGDKPAVIYPNGAQYWYQNGKPHRDGDKPAVIYADGSQFFYKNGKRHSLPLFGTMAHVASLKMT